MCGDGGTGSSSNDNSSWGRGDAIDRGSVPAGSPEAVAAAGAAANANGFGLSNIDNSDNFGVSQGLAQGARDAVQGQASRDAAAAARAEGDFGTAAALDRAASEFDASAAAAGYGQKGVNTYDVTNGWGNSFFGNWAYGGPAVAVRGALPGFIANPIANFIDNPVRGITNFAFGMLPATNPVVALAQAANAISGLLGGKTVGDIAQGAVRGDPNMGLGQLATVDTSTVGPDGRQGPGGAFDQGGNDNGWSGITSLLDGPGTQSSTARSTTPSTVASTDQRTSYGFSGGQGVDYAELSDGFGGTNVGGRSGWRAAGAGEWG